MGSSLADAIAPQQPKSIYGLASGDSGIGLKVGASSGLGLSYAGAHATGADPADPLFGSEYARGVYDQLVGAFSNSRRLDDEAPVLLAANGGGMKVGVAPLGVSARNYRNQMDLASDRASEQIDFRDALRSPLNSLLNTVNGLLQAGAQSMLSSPEMAIGAGMSSHVAQARDEALTGVPELGIEKLNYEGGSRGIGPTLETGFDVLQLIAGGYSLVRSGVSLINGIRAGTVGPVGVPYNGLTGPGPLGPKVASTFRSGSYTELTTSEPTTMYRVWGGKVGEIGPYWTRTPPSGPVQSIVDSALNPSWGNTATNVTKIQVPPGVKIYEGTAASQGGLVGGGNQIFIPKVDPLWILK